MSTRTPVRVLAPPTFATIAVTLFLAFPANATAQTTATANVVHDPALLQALEYRSVGPHRGGRVTAVTGVVSDVSTYYMGSSDGGVWKTTDGGNTWGNVSDGFFQAGSMGALAVALTDPNVVYAGTGSACIRRNVSSGAYRGADVTRCRCRATSSLRAVAPAASIF